MSVQSNQYVIYGVKLPCDDEYEKYEGLEDSAFDDNKNDGGLLCLYDGMNGDYIVVGTCLQKSELYYPLDYIELKEPDDEIKNKTKVMLKEQLNIDSPLSLHVITHYR